MIEWIREFLELRYIVMREGRIVFMTGDRRLAQYYAGEIPGTMVHRRE